MPGRVTDVLAPTVFLVLALALWEAVVFAFDIPSYLLPPPSAIAITLFTEIFSLARHTAVTVLEALLGFFLANVLGFTLAVVFAHSRLIEQAVMPYAIVLKTTPVIALAPLLVLWFGIGLVSKIVTAALICFFPILVSATAGLRSPDREALDLFASLTDSKWQVFRLLRLPASLPYVFSALKISSSLSVVGAVVGEFVGANEGLGYIILVSSYHLETAKMFAAIILLGGCGIIFYWIVSWFERVAIFWREPLEA